MMNALEIIGAPRRVLSASQGIRSEERFSAQDRWVGPYGTAADILRWLKTNDSPDFRRKRPPICLVTNGEGAKACLTLASSLEFLKPEDRIIATCTSERKLLEEALGRPVDRVPIPVTPDFAPKSREVRARLKRKLGFASSERLIVYAGRLSLQKNVHQLLSAFAFIAKEVPQARLVILGSVDQLGYPHFGEQPAVHYAHVLGDLVFRLGLEERVVFPGHVSQKELRDWLAACDLHISLSTHYGEDFGYSVAQGLMSGAPTVLSSWGGHLDFIGAGVAQAVPVRVRRGKPEVSVRDAVRAILQALQPSRNETLRRRAAAYAQKELSMEASAKHWRRVFSRARARKANQFRLSRTFSSYKKRYRSQGIGAMFAGVSDPIYRRVLRAYSGDWR
jgi:glycosyltransferase involved in cell wall biosynthesis